MSRKIKSTSGKPLISPLAYLVIGMAFITLFVQTQAFDPFNTPKLAALLVIASLFAVKLFSLTEAKFLKKAKANLLFVTLLAIFTLSGFISVVFSDNLFVALVGDTQRRNGYLAYLALSILCLSSYALTSFKNSLTIFKVTIATGVIFSFYGLIQMSGRDIVAWNNPNNAVIGTAGNPNFASALMAIFGIASITSLFVFTKSRFMQVIAMVCTIMCIVAIIGSDSRQGLVALFLGSLFFLVIYVYSNHKKLGSLLVLFSVGASLFVVAGMLQKGPLTYLLYKPSLSVRGYYWEAAIEMFKNYPIVGIGFDHYGYYFKEMRSPNYPLEFGFNLTSTNAHNTFLQMFANGGVLLGSSYLALVIATLLVGLKLVKDSSSQNRVIALSLLTIWIVFQAQSFISIDNLAISVWGWFLTGAIFGLYYESTLVNEKVELLQYKSKHQHSISPPSIVAFVLLVMPSVVLSVLLLKTESSIFKIDSYFVNYSNQKDKNSDLSRQIVNDLDKNIKVVLNSFFVDPNYKLQVSYTLFDLGDQSGAVKIIKDVVNEFPRNIYAVKALGVLQSNFQLEEAIEARNKLSLLDPWNADNYLQLLYMYKRSGDLVNAQLMRDKILSFAPGTVQAKSAIEELMK